MEPTIGAIHLFAGNFAPLYFVYCNGQLMSIAENTALFSILGTTYGGDGQVTFGVPNLNGRVPIGAQRDQSNLGEMAGHESTTLLPSQLPSHTHVLNIPTTDGQGSTDDPTNNIMALQNANVFAAPATASGSYGNLHATGVTGGSQSFPTLAPYLALHYILCTEGIYPSRN